MIAASPNWRSRSSSSARFPQCLASEAERFVDSTVLPVPPLGEKTVTRRPCRPPPFACCLRPAWQAFLIEKTTLSVSCGSSRTSAMSASSASSSRLGEPPEASRITGAFVYSRIAATSFAGSVALRVACSTTCRCPPVRVEAPSRTLSLEPTSSISGCFPSASRRSGRPSQTPLTKTRMLSRPFISISFVLIEDLLPSKGTARAAAEAVAEHRCDAVEVVGAVGCVRDRPELEVPGAAGRRVAVGEHPLVLLGLAVGHRKQHGRCLVRAAGELAAGRRPAGGREHLQVAQDDPAEEGVATAPVRRDCGNQVDVVVVLERSGEKLVLISRDLERAQIPPELTFDARLRERGKALSGDLLACERLLRGDEALDLVRTRDRPRYDAPTRHLGRGGHAHGVGTGGADRDVVLRDKHRHVVLAPLHMTLVIRHVKAG